VVTNAAGAAGNQNAGGWDTYLVKIRQTGATLHYPPGIAKAVSPPRRADKVIVLPWKWNKMADYRFCDKENAMAKSAKAPASFETALAQLEDIIQAMEGGDVPLETALASYKQGVELIKFCQGKLSDAEQQLKILENDELKPLDLSNGQ
jgi:exodeoxyribonuclease VII small subunit